MAHDFDPMPRAHDADEGPGKGDYWQSGTDIRCTRLADGHAYLAMAAVAFCGCYRTTEAHCGQYPGKLILPELHSRIIICPIMV